MPNVYLIGGPNGAGKTTVALRLFPEILTSKEFVNADLIARGLSTFDVASVATAAGRIMLRRLDELMSRKKDFAFESTLSSRSFVSFLRQCKQSDYRVTLMYVWIESAELAIERIRSRVREGGHSIPEDIVTRRYERSISNFVNLYLPLADDWRIYDNTHAVPGLIAYKDSGKDAVVVLTERMQTIMRRQVQEPEAEYVANKIDLAVKAAVAEELDRKRKLGLPIVFGRDGKIVVMVGDKIVEERPYSQTAIKTGEFFTPETQSR